MPLCALHTMIHLALKEDKASPVPHGSYHTAPQTLHRSLRAQPEHPTREVPLGNTGHGINTILPYARDSMTAWCALAASASGNS
jgi:hypothetical protein